MKIDMKGFMDQLSDLFIEGSIESMLEKVPESDALLVKKSLDIFAKYGIPKLTALNIIVELGEVSEYIAKSPTKYVCNHCGEKFDKDFPNIESVMAYHMQTEHPDEFDDTIDLIDDNFTEE